MPQIDFLALERTIPSIIKPSTVNRQPSTFNLQTVNLQSSNLQPSTIKPSTFNLQTIKPSTIKPSTFNPNYQGLPITVKADQ